MNENPSVRIESTRSKTSNNGPLKNGSAVSIARLYVGSKIVCFYESDHAFKTICQRPRSCHLIKIKACFLKPDRPVFIIVINTSCSGICYRIYARQKFLDNALAPNGALVLFGIFAGRISCNKTPSQSVFITTVEDFPIQISLFRFIGLSLLRYQHHGVCLH